MTQEVCFIAKDSGGQWEIRRLITKQCHLTISLVTKINADSSIFDTHFKTINHERLQGFNKTSVFHSFDPYLVVADNCDLSILDWQSGTVANSFPNFNPEKSVITSLKFINEEDSSILLVGSNDGTVKLYKDYENPDKNRLLSAWSASNDFLPNSWSKFVCEWHQFSGSIFTGGSDSTVLKCWDADEESCVQEIQLERNDCITTINSEVNGNLILCGFKNSSLKVLDRRLPPNSW